MQLTPRAQRVIDLAYENARCLNNNYIGSEHLLLGLIHEGDGLAGRVLIKLGATLERTRREVYAMQEGEAKPADGGGAPVPVTTAATASTDRPSRSTSASISNGWRRQTTGRLPTMSPASGARFGMPSAPHCGAA